MLNLERNQAKLLFVNPCLRRNSYTKLLPVGLATVMTFIEQQGFVCNLFDIDINEYEDSFVENYIRNNEHEVILLGSIVTHYKWVKWFVKMVKSYHPNTVIIVGNSVAGSIPEVFLRNSGADFAVIGEGEVTCFEILEALRTGRDKSEIEGIAFIDHQGNFVETPKRKAIAKLDEQPMINWDFFEIERYLSFAAYTETLGRKDKAESRPMPVVTARGCAFKCTFCHYVFWNDPYRFRSPKSILAEVKRNMDKYNSDYVTFWDDLSFASAKQAEKLADEILASGLKFHWSASLRVDMFSLSKLDASEALTIAKKLRQSGCLSVGFSLESGNAAILEMMNKKIEVQHFLDTVNIMKEAGIVCNTSVVFGYPIETKESIMETFHQCLKVGIYPSIGFLLPLPGTGMYQYAKDHGFIIDEDKYLDSITERQDICLNMTKLTNDEIMDTIIEGARLLNSALELNMPEEQFIRTKGYVNDKGINESKTTTRNENDFSFNYSNTVFEVDAGIPS